MKMNLTDKALLSLAFISLIYGIVVRNVDIFNSFYIFWMLLSAILVGIVLLNQKLAWQLPKFIKSIFYVLLGVFIISFTWVQIGIGSHFKDKIGREKKYILVLGNAISENKPSQTLKYRLDEAYDYLKKYDSICIVTGGKSDGEKHSEARVMKDYLVKKGIDEKRILMEERSTNTKENMVLSQELIPSDSDIGIITSDTHLYRSLFIAEKEGLKNISGHAAKTQTPLYINNMTREYFLFIKYILGI